MLNNLFGAHNKSDVRCNVTVIHFAVNNKMVSTDTQRASPIEIQPKMSFVCPSLTQFLTSSINLEKVIIF
jgi:hypothetical protein